MKTNVKHNSKSNSNETDIIRFKSPLLNDKNHLYDLYAIQQLSMTKIAEIIGVSRERVSKALKFHEIPKRKPQEQTKIERIRKSTKSWHTNPLLKNKDKLYDLYIVQKLSVSQICQLAKTYNYEVHKALEFHGISRRTYLEQMKITRPKNPLKRWQTNPILNDKEKLNDLYVVQKLSIRKIVKITKTHHSEVREALKHHCIPQRARGEQVSIEMTKHYKSNQPKSKIKTEVLERLNNRKYLENLYIKKNMTIRQIAEELGCGRSTVGRYLKKYGIKIRPSPLGKKLPLSTQQLLDDRDFIHQKYVIEQLSMLKIGSILNCSEKVVHKALKKHGIPRRDRAYATHLSKRNIIPLTSQCLELVEGSLLGDGSLSKGKYSSYFTIKQSKTGINGLSKKGIFNFSSLISS